MATETKINQSDSDDGGFASDEVDEKRSFTVTPADRSFINEQALRDHSESNFNKSEK
jgi:secreted protein with Ig-like and vWFA domain